MTPANASHSDWFIDDRNIKYAHFGSPIAMLAKHRKRLYRPVTWNVSSADFYPRSVLACGYCYHISLRVCACRSTPRLPVRSLLFILSFVQARNTKLGQRTQRPWLRSLLISSLIDLDPQVQIWLWNQTLPHFEFVRTVAHHQFMIVLLNSAKYANHLG